MEKDIVSAYQVAVPVYFVYLLRHYCRGGLVRGFSQFSVLGAVVGAVFAAAFSIWAICVSWTAQEYPIKVVLLLLHTILLWFGFSVLFPKNVATKGPLQADKKVTQSESKGSSQTAAEKQLFELG
ncbi:hypothetical protein V6N13_077507 [Hibiscus sabdariffa]